MKNSSLLLLAVASVISAQEVSISGTVTSEGGGPLEGVVVRLLSANIEDVTGADGIYSLTGQVSTVPRTIQNQSIIKKIHYRKNQFYFHSSSPQTVSVKLYDMHGSLLATVYKGRLQQGQTVVPFPLEGYGHNIFLMKVKNARHTVTYKLVSMGKNTYSIFDKTSLDEKQILRKSAQLDWLQASKEGYATHLESIGSYTGTIDIVMTLPATTPDFGPNVFIFDPSMAMSSIQSQCNDIFGQQESDQMGGNRYAFLFKPGTYDLDVNVGYYTHVVGLGLVPDDVTINGAVRVEADWFGGNATHNFWRGCENLHVVPSGGTNRWAVSQADPFRRMHIEGNMQLDDGGWSSGGFIADSKIDGNISSGSQQQWFSRNAEIGGWSGSVWNMFFIGVTGAPSGDSWPNPPYVVVDQAPILREKPYLMIDGDGNYFIYVPELRQNVAGHSWANGQTGGEMVSIDQFYIAHPSDNAASINAALAEGKNLFLTPGIYHLEAAIEISRPGTIVYGLGFPSLIPDNGTSIMEIADVGGVLIAGGIMYEGSPAKPRTLLQVGESGSSADHSANPTCLYDIFCRTGGGFNGATDIMVEINSNNVIGDHFWLWRADHGNGVGWTSNECANGCIVNGNDVTIYGHFNEHNQEYQTLWNGEGGRNYFYQCEMPYDPPSFDAWSHDGVAGWAGYKVADDVQTHEAWGLGVYCAFRNGVNADNAIETSTAAGVTFHNIVTISLGGSQGTINNTINGTGGAADARILVYP
jgi:hypothetical protein